MTHKQNDTVWCFIHGKPSQSGNLKTDGICLYSYNLLLAHRVGETVILDFKSRNQSVTTMRHINTLETVLKERGGYGSIEGEE